MHVIGLSGKKASGKDEVCKAIKAIYPNKFVERIAFADALKQEVAVATMRSIEYIEAHKDNFRLILQGWGTDFKRKLMGDDYWIRQFWNKASSSKADIIVVPDVRFMNEFETLTNVGAHLWRINRDFTSRDSHPSEIDLDNVTKWETEINNNGTLIKLRSEVALKCQMYIK